MLCQFLFSDTAPSHQQSLTALRGSRDYFSQVCFKYCSSKTQGGIRALIFCTIFIVSNTWIYFTPYMIQIVYYFIQSLEYNWELLGKPNIEPVVENNSTMTDFGLCGKVSQCNLRYMSHIYRAHVWLYFKGIVLLALILTV